MARTDEKILVTHLGKTGSILWAIANGYELADVIRLAAFKTQMKDIIEYRTMEYYRRRYVEK